MGLKHPLRRRTDLPRRLWRRFSSDAAARVIVAFVVLLAIATAAVEVDHVTAGRALDRARHALAVDASALHKSEAALSSAQAALSSARAALAQARQADGEAHLIQASRAAACEDTDARHDATLRVLRALAARQLRRTRSAAARRLERQNLASAELIIGALDPKRNCAAFVGP